MKFREVLEKYKEISLSERHKGEKFESLMKKWFLSTPLYSNNIESIWLWGEFPYRDQFGGSDSGIDIVILTKENEYQAVQCKFYSDNNKIDKADVDTFISTSGRLFEIDSEKIKFSSRIFMSTTNHWTKKALDSIKNQEIPVTRISTATLEDSGVNWSKLVQGKIGEEARKARKTIRDHQSNVLNAVETHFSGYDRGKLIMACGTGKTFTSLKIAERETGGNGLILFLIPSIALLGQTLREWTNDIETKLLPICICSDPKITKKANSDNSEISVVDLALPATTDIKKIVHQLKVLKDKKEKGLKVVFSTYQSIEVISNAQKNYLSKKIVKILEFLI